MTLRPLPSALSSESYVTTIIFVIIDLWSYQWNIQKFVLHPPPGTTRHSERQPTVDARHFFVSMATACRHDLVGRLQTWSLRLTWAEGVLSRAPRISNPCKVWLHVNRLEDTVACTTRGHHGTGWNQHAVRLRKWFSDFHHGCLV